MSDGARICVIGSITMDLVVRAPRFPAPGETLLGGSYAQHPGGKGANQAIAAARMGAAVTLIGAVGDDAYGRAQLDLLSQQGLDPASILVRKDSPTGVGLITIAQSGENSIVVASGANMTISPEEIDAQRNAIATADVLLLQLEIPLAAVKRAAEIARDVGTTVILNAAPALSVPADLLAATDVLIVNELEAAAIGMGRARMSPTPCRFCRVGAASGEPGREESPPLRIAEAVGGLAGLGVAHTIVTLGAQGCGILHERTCTLLDAFEVEAIDTVGAGDAFCGVFATRYAELMASGGISPGAIFDAACWGSAAGALATTAQGAIPSLPTRAEVRSLLARR